LIADITADLGRSTPAVVVIDTLNRTINGSENKDEDMGRFIKAADTIQRAFGCVVVIIHHSGVSGDRPRGHTSLSGANDAQIAVERNDRPDHHDRRRTARVAGQSSRAFRISISAPTRTAKRSHRAWWSRPMMMWVAPRGLISTT
jgi:RecA-family ATPase